METYNRYNNKILGHAVMLHQHNWKKLHQFLEQQFHYKEYASYLRETKQNYILEQN